MIKSRIHFCYDDNSSLRDKGIHHFRNPPLVQPSQDVQLGPEEPLLVFITDKNELCSILASCEFIKDTAHNTMSASEEKENHHDIDGTRNTVKIKCCRVLKNQNLKPS